MRQQRSWLIILYKSFFFPPSASIAIPKFLINRKSLTRSLTYSPGCLFPIVEKLLGDKGRSSCSLYIDRTQILEQFLGRLLSCRMGVSSLSSLLPLWAQNCLGIDHWHLLDSGAFGIPLGLGCAGEMSCNEATPSKMQAVTAPILGKDAACATVTCRWSLHFIYKVVDPFRHKLPQT